MYSDSQVGDFCTCFCRIHSGYNGKGCQARQFMMSIIMDGAFGCVRPFSGGKRHGKRPFSIR